MKQVLLDTLNQEKMFKYVWAGLYFLFVVITDFFLFCFMRKFFFSFFFNLISNVMFSW